MESSRDHGRRRQDPDYEQLLYESQSQRTDLEKRVAELQLQVEKLQRENTTLKNQIDDLEKASKAGEHGLRRIGPMGKPVVW